MTPFFRKIRQHLVTEGKLSKYLTYAIGEIFLVMIGILLAIQVNNWNENRKQAEVTNTYYKQILVDLETDKKYATDKRAQLDSSVLKYSRYKRIFSQPNLRLDTLIKNIQRLDLNTYNLEFKTTTILSLINTGDIKLLKPNLRDQLIAYYGKRKQASDISNNNNANALNILQSALKKGGIILMEQRILDQEALQNVLKLDTRWPEIYLELETFFAWKDEAERISITALKDIISEADSIHQLIESELE